MQRAFRQKSFTLPYSFQHNVSFFELPYFPTLWQQMHSKLSRRMLNEAHASMCVCVLIFHPHMLFVLQTWTWWACWTRMKRLVAFNQPAWEHPLRSNIDQLFFFLPCWFFFSVKHIFGLWKRCWGSEDDCDVKQKKKTLRSVVRCFQDGHTATGQEWWLYSSRPPVLGESPGAEPVSLSIPSAAGKDLLRASSSKEGKKKFNSR